MIAELRKQFNDRWTAEGYQTLLRRLDESAGTPVSFRISETPIFLPDDLTAKMVRYGSELYDQLLGNPEYLERASSAVPPEFRAPNENTQPLFLQADFGIVREPDGRLEPKLVEIQGFPSIYAFQTVMAEDYCETYRLRDLHPHLTTYFGGLTKSTYFDRLRSAILNGHDPEQVVLLEIDPYEQKTLPDFLITQKELGIKIADIRQVKKQGRKLLLDGREIKRIYNRVIVDELVRKNIVSDFRFADDVDLEWAGHPNWFFKISKFSLPWFRHVCVPRTWFLSELSETPVDLQNYVLKPLYSFAGLGVKIEPTREEIDAIPDAQRQDFILQEKVNFVPTVDTPSGPTKLEVRVMYIWNRDRSLMEPVTTLLRTGRGKMMGVDFNKNLDWIGASAGFLVAAPG